MSDSDQSSGGMMAGTAGVGSVLLICVLVGLKVAARTVGRTIARNDFSQNDSPPGDPNAYTIEGARQTSIVARPVPVNPSYQPTPTYTPPPVAQTPEEIARQQEEDRLRREKALSDAYEEQRRREAAVADAGRTSQTPETAPADPDLDRQRREQELANGDGDRERREKALADAERARAEEAARPAAPQPGTNPDVPPGFPITAVDQVKPKGTVFVRDQAGWFPAIVLNRRGAEVTVRYTTNGVVDRVALNRIRLQTESATNGANDGPPAALRPVASSRDPANKPEPEDDALIVAKPRKGEDVATEQPVVATPSVASPAANAPVPAIRTWSNETGEFKVDAELVGFEFDLVQLKKSNGKVVSIPIQKLSAADQAFVRERYK